MAMIAMTTSNSINVNAYRFECRNIRGHLRVVLWRGRGVGRRVEIARPNEITSRGEYWPRVHILFTESSANGNEGGVGVAGSTGNERPDELQMKFRSTQKRARMSCRRRVNWG